MLIWIIVFVLTGGLIDGTSKPGARISEVDDRIQYEKFVDIPENVEMATENLCVGKVICEKHTKMGAVHNMLQHVLGRYSGVRVHELTNEVILFEF